MARTVRLFGALALVVSILGTAAVASGAATNHAKKGLAVMSINASPGFGLDWTLGQRGFFQRIDASGGIDGHLVTFSTCSDGTFIAQSQDLSYTCAQQAVASGVFAVTGSNSQFDNVVYPVLQAANIPDIGSFPNTPIDYTSKVDAVLVDDRHLGGRNRNPACAAGIARTSPFWIRLGPLLPNRTRRIQGRRQVGRCEGL